MPGKLKPLLGATLAGRVGTTAAGVLAASISGGQPQPGESPDGTKVPPATQIIDNEGAVWTLVGGTAFVNGAPTAGSGILLKYFGQLVYLQGNSLFWYVENATKTGWDSYGPSEPGGGPGPGPGPGPGENFDPPLWTTGVPTAMFQEITYRFPLGPENYSHIALVSRTFYANAVATIAQGDAGRVWARTSAGGGFPGSTADFRRGRWYWWNG